MNKYLIKDSFDKIQVLSEGEWLDTGLTEPLGVEDFKTYGMDGLNVIPVEKWDELDDEFEVLMWTDDMELEEPPKIEITVPPFRPLDKLDNQFSIVMGEYETE